MKYRYTYMEIETTEYDVEHDALAAFDDDSKMLEADPPFGHRIAISVSSISDDGAAELILQAATFPKPTE